MPGMLSDVPELPEVETIRRQLAPLVVGRRIVDAWAHPSPKFAGAVEAAGHEITAAARAGKYLVVGLDGGLELVVHLGMTGTLRVRATEDPGDEYVRAWWGFGDGESLEYRDVRRFGRIRVVPAGTYEGTLARQGPDALDGDVDAAAFWRALRSSRRAVKTQLLSQRPIAGVGNIYADEALWRARVHPKATRLSRARSAALLDAVQDVLRSSIDHGGTTLRDYRSMAGEPGSNQRHLECYGRAGEPCSRCGAALRRLMLDARATTYCARCQRH
jgi:formamidopyrimidine-DNA glycosylase